LFFVDALALLPGERVAGIVQRRTPYETSGSATGPSQADAEQRLFADLTPKDRSWALARYTLHPRAALEDPVQLDAFWEQAWSATVVRCRRSVNPPEAHQRRTAERLKAIWVELDAGHYPMLTHTDELTQFLLTAC
jgi:pimeloyl-ACP methyl ester carboxylesterase